MKIFKRIIIALVIIVSAAFIVLAAFPEKMLGLSMKMQRSGAGLEVKEILVDDHKIVYLEGGKGTETVVLLHGFGANKDNWIEMVRFMPGYHFIIPDLPGFGDSTKSESAKYDVASQADRLDRFFLKLGLKSIVIAGNSMGGNISGIYATKYPEKVKGLVLLNNSGVTAPVKSELLKSIEKGDNPLLLNSRDDYEKMIKFIFVKEPYIPGPFMKVLANLAIKNRQFNDKIFKDMITAPAMIEGRFVSLTMPVLIIWGDRDRLIDVSSVAVLEKGIKNHTTHILKNCGHVPMMERPEETAGYIKTFIGSLK